MKKLVLSLSFIFLFSCSVYAEQYILTCISDKDFMTVHSIDTKKKNIIHLSSKDLKSGKEYNSINRPKKVIHWNGDLVYVFNISNAGREIFMTIDLKNNKIVLTDIQKFSWISRKVDMNKIVLAKKYVNNVDIFIINQALHHCAYPSMLLKKMHKYLKKDGLILINEPEISFFLKFFLYILDDEGWSFKVNIFNEKKKIFDPNSPWDANNAAASLLFKNENLFHSKFPKYKIMKNELTEFFIFLNSGGVVQKMFHLPLNKFFFNILFQIDKFLIFLFPTVFALGRSVVLKKKS